MNLLCVAVDRPEGLRFNRKAEARRKSHCSHHAKFIFREAPVWLADSADDSSLQILLPAHEIQHFAAVVPHQQAVDGEVPAPYIFFSRLRIHHAVRMPAVFVADIRAECGYLHFQATPGDQDHAELRAHGNAIRKKSNDLIRRGIGGHVVIGRLAAEEQVAHASAHQQRLIPVALQRLANLVGEFPGLHSLIMRHFQRQKQITIFCLSERATCSGTPCR